MKLHDLRPADGSRQPRTRVGRGIAAGKGKTAGRGTKGQKARAGGSIPAWFEGGQTPLHMRIPKLRGFKNRFKIVYEGVNGGATRGPGAAAGRAAAVKPADAREARAADVAETVAVEAAAAAAKQAKPQKASKAARTDEAAAEVAKATPVAAADAPAAADEVVQDAESLDAPDAES